VVGGSLHPVKKTSIYIEPDVDVALARRAAAEGTTKAELIRQALRDAAGTSIRVKPRARGVFHGPADLSSHVDEHLADTQFGET
jgi:Ribbon-helix-helix protein, copG family